MSSENLLGLEPESPVVTRRIREAIQTFKSTANYEKELSSDSITLGHMIDFAYRRVLEMLLEGKSEDDIVKFLNRAEDSFSNNRRKKHPESNPIRVYKREH